MEQAVVFIVLGVTLALFVWDRFRYEGVALVALMVLVLWGIVPGDEAFAGFGHAAVVTVAAVLVISRALALCGAVDGVSALVARVGGGPTRQVVTLSAATAALSTVMNNVGALALLLPVALRVAAKGGHSPALVLMPMAFASLLGGLCTAIGTPPNLIVASFRERAAAEPFAFFDFASVGGPIAVLGVAFMGLLGWRLLPRRQPKPGEDVAFEIDEYVFELRATEGSPLVDNTIDELTDTFGSDIVFVGLVRGERTIPGHWHHERIRPEDILIVEGDAEDVKALVDKHKLQLAGRGRDATAAKALSLHLVEVVIMPNSLLAGRTAISLRLRARWGLNVLAVSQKGRRVRARLGRVRLDVGDVLMLEGEREQIPEALAALGCLPLARRDIRINQPRRAILAAALFAVAIVAAAGGWLPIHVSFVACAVAMGAFGLIRPNEAYRAIDWPILLLLGAMIPVGGALESTGGAATIAGALAGAAAGYAPIVALGVILLATMVLSDVVNNAAAAVLMCPIALVLADSLAASADPFLMAVAVGASCAFLTPVGHQSNMLVMGPGGYRFRDYWRLGLPLQILVAVVAMIMIPWVWPL